MPSRLALWWAAAAGLAVIAAALAGFIRFTIPVAAENDAAQTDAIVVLTGGTLRLQSGIDLMREGKGRALFVSGVNVHVNFEKLLRVSGMARPPGLTCCTAAGYEAENTMGNAAETALWMQQHGYHSLRLVTAWYHMPRSLLEFERAMPDIRILPHPVFPERVKQEEWWAWHGTAGLLLGEYAKYLGTLFRPLIQRSSPRGPEAIPSRRADALG